jgi:adenylate kinase
MPDSYKSILLFGPPGVGKGTQGKILGNIPGLHHLATGDIFRSLDRESELGRTFVEHSSRGELVPDDITIRIWQDHVRGLIASERFDPAAHMLVLDGVPRSVAQAAALKPHVSVLKIVHLRCVNMDEMVQRMKRRALMEGRHDDADESVIRRRFEVYEEETAPVLLQYEGDLVSEVDALGTPMEVLLRILEVLVPVYNESFGNPLEETAQVMNRR